MCLAHEPKFLLSYTKITAALSIWCICSTSCCTRRVDYQRSVFWTKCSRRLLLWCQKNIIGTSTSHNRRIFFSRAILKSNDVDKMIMNAIWGGNLHGNSDPVGTSNDSQYSCGLQFQPINRHETFPICKAETLASHAFVCSPSQMMSFKGFPKD